MIRVLHCADLHLDAPFSLRSPRQAERHRTELRSNLSTLTLLIKQQKIDLCLMSGDLFPGAELRYLANMSTKLTRLREDVDSLNNSVVHLQDAHQATMDLKLNDTMKILTVLTSIFFPLTIIVGWYGMNFVNMPELKWRFGYVYVIVLSLCVSGVLLLIAKKKKWL